MHRKISCNCFLILSIQNKSRWLWKVTQGMRNQLSTSWADMKKCLSSVKNFWKSSLVLFHQMDSWSTGSLKQKSPQQDLTWRKGRGPPQRYPASESLQGVEWNSAFLPYPLTQGGGSLGDSETGCPVCTPATWWDLKASRGHPSSN